MDTDYMSRLFWNENFWLPVGTSWEDLEAPSSKDVYYPRAVDMCWTLLAGVFLLGFRYFYERLIIVPIGRYLGIREIQRKAAYNKHLEESYKNGTRLDDKQMIFLQKETSMSNLHIRNWMRIRKLQDAPTTMLKFRECSWHLLFYTSAFIYGLVVLWNKNWVWHTEECWKGWPHHPIGPDLYIYYLIELGFYWSLILSLLMDIKRKDFKVMIIHHIATIILLYMSWVLNFIRIGALTLFVHDIVDPYLAGAKMAKYCKKQAMCESIFGIFVIVWIISRLGIYPFWVLHSVYFEIHDHVAPFPSFTVFATLLFILQILHIVWTYMIGKIAIQKFTHGEIHQDVRSDTESEEEILDEPIVPPMNNHVTSDESPKVKRRMIGDHDHGNQS